MNTQIRSDQEIRDYIDRLQDCGEDCCCRGMRAEIERLYRENAALRDRLAVANDSLERKEIVSEPGGANG